jgi:hypothetical protein
MAVRGGIDHANNPLHMSLEAVIGVGMGDRMYDIRSRLGRRIHDRTTLTEIYYGGRFTWYLVPEWLTFYDQITYGRTRAGGCDGYLLTNDCMLMVPIAPGLAIKGGHRVWKYEEDAGPSDLKLEFGGLVLGAQVTF